MKALEDFEAGFWGQRYPAISQSWRRNWNQVVPFFAFPESVRRIIYTTDEIDKLFVLGVVFFRSAGDLVAKRNASAGSAAGLLHSSLAGLRGPRARPFVGRGFQCVTNCS
jgi:mutator family transposase